jgi:hypothetical protein
MPMKDRADRRKQLQEAIGLLGAEGLPSRGFARAFKHEGNRHWFSGLKHAEEEFLLQAILRQDRYGNVQAGGPDTIAEGLMHSAEATMRESLAAILFDDEEAHRIVDAFVSHVWTTFRLPSRSADEGSRARAGAGGFWGLWKTRGPARAGR